MQIVSMLFSSFITLIVLEWLKTGVFHLMLSNNNLWDYVYIKYKLLIFKEPKYKSPLLSFNSTNIQQEPEQCTLEELFCLLSLPLDYNPRELVLTRDWTQFKSVSK